MNLVRAELLKIRTTASWWIYLLIFLPLWGLTLLFNIVQTDYNLDPATVEGLSPKDSPDVFAAADPVNVAANLYTNGQFFSVLLVMLLGAIVVTNEFFHQTVTTTFLTTPRRTAVVLAKLAASSLLGLALWLITTLLNLPATLLTLGFYDVGSQLGEGAVWRAIALNALAYLLWAVFGVGFGVLIRSQIGATITGIVLYFVGFIGPAIVFALLARQFGDWIENLEVLIPSVASQLMVSGTDLPGSPPQWSGAVVLIGYAVVTGVIGTLIMRKRDIS